MMTALAQSRLTGRPVANSSALAVQPLSPALVPAPRVEQSAPTLGTILMPDARDRWQTLDQKRYTPQFVESVMRGAASGNLVAQWEMFDLMEQTWPRLNKNLNELKDSAIGHLCNLQPWAKKGAKPTATAQERADLIEHAMWNMRPEIAADENDFEDTLRDLLDARGKGIAVLEIDWEVRDVPFGTGKATLPRATRWIHPKFYGYPSRGVDRLMLNAREILQTRSVIGVDSQEPIANSQGVTDSAVALIQDRGDGFSLFPADKFLIGLAKTKSGHPISGAMLRTLGFWWAATNFAPGWFLNYCQIFGMPFRWANYDTAMTPTDQTKLARMLANMGSAAWGMFPAGTALEFKEATKSAGENAHKVLLEFADKQCDVMILRQTLTTEVGSTGGNRALGEVHERKEADVETNVAEWAAKILRRQLFEPICRFNYGNTDECPWLMAEEEVQPDPKSVAEFVAKANEVVDIPKTWAYEKMGIPQPGAGEEVIERKAAPDPFGGAPNGAGGPAVPAQAKSQFTIARAKDATEMVANVALEELTGISAKWLAPVKPTFVRLVKLAQDDSISDSDFIAACAKAQKEFPEFFGKLNTEVLAEALEKAMGAATANGYLAGAMTRRGAK